MLYQRLKRRKKQDAPDTSVRQSPPDPDGQAKMKILKTR